MLGVDISEGALAVAAGQSFEQESPACVDPEFILADVLGDIPSGMGEFDVLVSNPPYVMESERQLMRRNVLVEINEALGKETADVFVKVGFHDVKVIQDLNSRDRFISAIQ